MRTVLVTFVSVSSRTLFVIHYDIIILPGQGELKELLGVLQNFSNFFTNTSQNTV